MPTVNVTIVSARELHREDINNNDAFVEAWLDEHYKQRTSVIKNASLPEWNETLSFNVPEGSNDHKLYLKVLDKDTFSADKVGEGKLDIRPVLSGEVPVLEEEVNLPAKLGLTSHGKVLVRVSL
ncbi:unnamed protein product [Cunninghamella blakesleeana]